MVRRVLTWVVAVLAAGAAPAAAQVPAPAVSVVLDPADGVRAGAPLSVTGQATLGARPVAGQAVVLEARPYPFQAAFAPVANGITGADGSYALEARFALNQQLRVTVPAAGGGSLPVRAYVFPAFRLSFATVREHVVRLTQVYTVPAGVRLTRPTLFYVGPRGARSGRLRATAKTRRTSATRYVARAAVRLPARYRGRFRYASCFRYSKGSGMGDPGATCPSERFRFEEVDEPPGSSPTAQASSP
jgi:hypothetical protein